MKKNYVWWLLFTIVVFVVVLFCWRLPLQHVSVPLKTDHTTNLLLNNTNHVIRATSPIPSTTNKSEVKANTSNTTSSLSAEPRAIQIQKILEGRNVPICFYGRVIDQNSNNLSNVRIVARIQQPYFDPANYSTDAHQQKIETITDANGQFVIQNVIGATLAIEAVDKEGYKLSPKAKRTYAYGDAPQPHHPDSQNPIIIRMWKLGEPQQLIHHYLSGMGIPVNAQPVQFDLFNGKKVSSGGQLIVRLNRNPQIIAPRTRYDWSLELEIPSGGLATNNDELMYQAPAGGYQKIFNYDMPKDAENWTAAINQQFYIELENENYFGSVIVRLNTIHDTPPLGISLDIVINPNGSRSLQP